MEQPWAGGTSRPPLGVAAPHPTAPHRTAPALPTGAPPRGLPDPAAGLQLLNLTPRVSHPTLRHSAGGTLAGIKQTGHGYSQQQAGVQATGSSNTGNEDEGCKWDNGGGDGGYFGAWGGIQATRRGAKNVEGRPVPREAVRPLILLVLRNNRGISQDHVVSSSYRISERSALFINANSPPIPPWPLHWKAVIAVTLAEPVDS